MEIVFFFLNKKGDKQLAYAPTHLNIYSALKNKYRIWGFADTFFAGTSRKLSFVPAQATSGSAYSLTYPVFSCKHFYLSKEGLFLCQRANSLS